MPTTAEERLDRMLGDFERDNAQRSEPARMLRSILDTTSGLRDRVLATIEHGTLSGFTAERRNAGGYDPETGLISLDMAVLKNAGSDPRAANSIHYTLAHELHHAMHADELSGQDSQLRQRAQGMVQAGGPRDYTDALRDYDALSRGIEARAEIAGFNALADHVRAAKPGATLRDVHEAAPNDTRPYINRQLDHAPRQGIQIDASLHLVATPDNERAIAALYYDANRYARGEFDRGIGIVRDVEADAGASAAYALPTIDMRALGFARARVPDGFAQAHPQPSAASTADAPGPMGADAPRSGGGGPAERAEPSRTRASASAAMPDGPEPSARPRAARPTPDDPRHADHAFFADLQERLPPVPANAVAHAMLEAKRAGMRDASFVNPGHVALVGDTVWIGGGGKGEGMRASLKVEDALPMAEVGQRLDVLAREQHTQEGHGMQTRSAARTAAALVP